MTRWEVPWKAFGRIEVEAETEDEAIAEASEQVKDGLFSVEWDGLDITEADPIRQRGAS